MANFNRGGTVTRRKLAGRQLCTLEDGRRITFKDNRYYCEGERMQAETALIILMEQCRKSADLQHRLRLALPKDDYRIINGDGLGWSPDHLVPKHETYLIKMITATEPPRATGSSSLNRSIAQLFPKI